MYRGIIVTGTSGSGKSAVVDSLCDSDPSFAHVPAVTTRAQRADDRPGTYSYLTGEEFAKLVGSGRLLVQAEYRGESYGIRQADVDAIVKKGRTPILTITPESAAGLDGLENDDLKKHLLEPAPARRPTYFSVFVDAPDDVLDSRLQGRKSSAPREEVLQHRSEDRRYSESFLYWIENVELDTSAELIRSLWHHRATGGVVSARLIHLLMGCHTLLKNGERSSVSGASYDLLLGDEYFYGGEILTLSRQKPILTIEPYDYAIVTSRESCDLPRDVCGRFDLAVSMFCQGIILSNGPQVDPGFRGVLFCLLFNTSSRPVQLKRGQHYATIEFHKLVEPTYRYGGRYREKYLDVYLPVNATWGAINELKKELERVSEEGRGLQVVMLAVWSLILALLAVWVTVK